MSHDAEFEVAVYMHNFHNLDLFQQGWYEVKVTCRWENGTRAGQPSRVVQYGCPDVKRGEADTVWRIDDSESSFHTRPFKIRYSQQEVFLQEMVSFHLKVGKQDCVIVKFELLFGAQSENLAMDKPPEEMKPISEHSFRLMSGDCTCMHQFVPVTFDTSHFVFLEASVHSVLLTFKHTINTFEHPSSATEKLLESQSVSAEAASSVQVNKAAVGLQELKEVGAERTKKRLPCSADLDLLSSLLGSQRKMNNELQLYLQQADERSIKLPVVKRSKINEKLEELLVRHGHYEVTDSDAEDSSSADSEDDHTTATGSNDKNSQLHPKYFQTFDVGSKSSVELGQVNVVGEANLSAEEYNEAKQELSLQLGALWNVFLTLHRLHHKTIREVLRRRWVGERAGDAAQWVVESAPLPSETPDVVSSQREDWSGLWRERNIPLKVPPPEKSFLSASRAELYRTGLADAKCKFVRFQDLQIFGNPAAQPIVFVEHAAKPAEDLSSSSGNSREGSLRRNAVTNAANVAHLKPEDKHVVVFVHGFQGHHLDLRLLRNHWMLLDPRIECIMSESNEDGTFDAFADMGGRLAREVAHSLQHTFGTEQKPNRYKQLRKLSFVGHSIGNIIIRAALTDEALKPYLPCLHTFFSISAPHLGYLYGNNNLFNGVLWMLKKLHNRAAAMHELTLTDAPELEDCYLYKISQDRYVPYHSARIELCPAALRDVKHGAAYAAMVNGCLGSILQGADSGKKCFVRCDVNFNVAKETKNLNTFIGRKAHIDFLETDVYIRFILWAYSDRLL